MPFKGMSGSFMQRMHDINDVLEACTELDEKLSEETCSREEEIKKHLNLMESKLKFEVPDFPEETKHEQNLRIIQLKEAGNTWRQIYELMGETIPQRVMRYRYRRYKNHGTVHDLKRSGRPRKMSESADKFVLKQVLDNRRVSLRQISEDLEQESGGTVNVSTSTLSRRLKSMGVNRKLNDTLD